MAEENVASKRTLLDIVDAIQARAGKILAIGALVGRLKDVDIPDGTHAYSSCAIVDFAEEINDLASEALRSAP